MPVPVGEFESPRFRTPDALRRESEAVLYQRRLFNELAAGWLAAFPASSNALEALAISLDMLGDARAPDTLRRARSLATSPGDRQRLGALEVWFRLRVTIPGDLRGVGEARLLADSVLAAGGALANTEPLLLASVAALTGRAARAASLARHPRAEREWSVPAGLGRAVPGLLAYAAMGGPEDSIAALYETVRTAIERAVPSPDREAMRLGWLGRPATLAFPQFRLRAIGALSGSGDPLVDVVGISDEQPQRMEEAVRTLGSSRDRAFTDYRACLEKAKPDIVILCPAASKHGEWVKKVAPYGVHIMVEKPFAA
jgi:hypothetical protein